MSPEEAIDAAAAVLSFLLKPENAYDGSTLRKLNLGIEHVGDVVNPAKLQATIDAAAGDPELDAMLCSYGAALVGQAENIPKPLRAHIANKLKSIASARTKTGKRGRHSHDNLIRDFAIIYVIARLRDAGFDPYRNPVQRTQESGISITHKGLCGSEGTQWAKELSRKYGKSAGNSRIRGWITLRGSCGSRFCPKLIPEYLSYDRASRHRYITS